MKPKQLILLFGILLIGSVTLKAQNPYKSLGVEVETLTLSKGKFVEFFPNDSLVQIGSVMFNTRTNSIASFVVYDTTYSEATLEPEVSSRFLSPDPLRAIYPSLSPYNYVTNNPVNAIDPDGRAVIFVNGFPFDGETGASYWCSFASDIMSYFPGESSHFFDGGRIMHHNGRTESVSMWSFSGRLSSTMTSNLYSGSGDFDTRVNAGYSDGKHMAKKLSIV